MSDTRVTSFRFGSYRLDVRERMLYRDGRLVPLTPKAVDTLRVLVERQGRLLTKDDLLREVWPDVVVEENNLAQNISMLRKALGQGGNDTVFIETVPKRGYRFVAPVIADHEPVWRSPETLDAFQPQSSDDAGSAIRVSPKPLLGRRQWMALVLTPALVALMWFAWSTSSSRSVLTDVRADTEHPTSSASSLPRIAVLPFVNLGPTDGEYLAGGTTEELTSRLARNPRLRVVSSTSAREYDSRGKTLRQIGDALGATYVVEGSVRRDPIDTARLRVIAKLIRVADDVTVWTEDYAVPLTAISDTHSDIVRQIDAVFDGTDTAAPVARMTSDPDAYLAYLRGVTIFRQARTDPAQLERARRELESAVARDPKFAAAWGWLGSALINQYSSGAERTPAVLEAAYRAAGTSIELAPNDPEGHLSMAFVLVYDQKYEDALRELANVGSTGVNAYDALAVEAMLREHRNEWREALQLLERAFDIDPAATADLLAAAHLNLRDYPQARRYVEVAKAANHVAASLPEAWTAFSADGDSAAARSVLEAAHRRKEPADSRVTALLARFEWMDGHYDRALQLIDSMDADGTWMPSDFRFPAAIARGQVYDSMGDTIRAKRNYAAALEQLRGRDPGDFQVVAARALAAAGLGRTEDAVRDAQRLVELIPVAKNAVAAPVFLYTAALVHARLGQPARAFEILDRMFEGAGFYNEVWIDREPWLASVRADPAFAEHRRLWTAQKGDWLTNRPPS